MPRIVSLLASVTEVVCALGCQSDLVGRSHECDYPPSVLRLPVCTAPKFEVHGTSAEIDARVKESLREGTSVYDVNAELLHQLRPDVVITQAQCEVCAVSLKDVERALCSRSAGQPRIVTLLPNSLADVWHDIAQVATALEIPERGTELSSHLQRRIKVIAVRVQTLTERPRVACLEWVEPLMAAGNWVPELVELAGGVNLFGSAGRHSPWLSWEELLEKDPDVIVAMPCGLDLDRTRREMTTLTGRPEWGQLSAARTGRVYVTDGNQFFNRPGPRLVESLEILAAVFYPQAGRVFHQGTGWDRL